MQRCQNPPRLWLMTDERIGAALWPALARLPRGAGVVFRHYTTEPTERRALFGRVRRIASAHGLVLVLAGTMRQAIAWQADGAHGRSPRRGPGHLLQTAPAHDLRAAMAATRAGADLVFVSPVFATRSHPGGRVLGIKGFGRVVRGGRGRMAGVGMPRVIALGGMTAARFRRLRPLGAYGWAAIDGLTPPPDQKRKVVPR